MPGTEIPQGSSSPHVENGHKWTISTQHDAAMTKARECCGNTEVQLHQLNQPPYLGEILAPTCHQLWEIFYIHNIWNKTHKHISLMIYHASHCEDYSDLSIAALDSFKFTRMENYK